MSTLQGWSSNLLRSVDLKTPDGRPLYAYRCTNGAFEELRGLLLDAWNPLGDPAGGRAFAVYAAEWWRRHYDGGPWAWEPLLDSIRCEVPFPVLYEPLRRAWRWWGVRPVVLGASVRYLGTCACQGGLPLRLVSSPSSNVHRFLRALLREYRIFRRVVDDGYALAEPLRSHLPRSLRQEPVYRLCAELMDQVWELRDVGAQEDPVASLDRHSPDWRSCMPIDLDDRQAHGLIVSLLHEAAKGGRADSDEFQVFRYITDTATGRRFVVEPRVPQRMAAAALARTIGVAPEELPRRFQLRIEGSRPWPLANGRVAGDDVVFVSVLPEPENLADLAASEIRWFVQAGRPVGESFMPRGGAAPADDLPWVFASLEDDELRLDLYAEGSVRTRFPRVAVACREEMLPTLLQHPDCRRSETQPIAGRVLFDVEGDLTLDTPVGRCRIRTAQECEQQFEHRLAGDRCLDLDAPLPLYRGAPGLWSVEPDGARRRVPPGQISWRAERGDRWVRNPDTPGVWRVRREVDGEIVFLSKICMAGAQFRAAIVPGPAATQGFLDIYGASLDVASEHPQVETQADRTAGRLRVTVRFVRGGAPGVESPLTEPPSHVKLATRWPNGSTLPLTVPFPGRGARFAHPERADADRRRALSVESLYGWRALAISPRASDAFRLHGELRADDLNERMKAAAHFDVPLQKTGEGVFELPLIEVHDTIESLFAATKLLDAQVRLELTSGGVTQAITVVRRFACDVGVSETGLHSVPARCVADGAPVAFEAFSLESPGRGRTPLEPVVGAEGRVAGWRLPDAFVADRQTGIVLARSGGEHFARPRVDSSAPGLVDAADVRSLPEAASIADMDDRIAAMDRILTDMVERGGAEHLEYLADLLDVSHGLPATTFDALDCLSGSPRALVQLLLRTPDERARARIWRLEYELPFTWLLVPVDVWRGEMRRTHGALLRELEETGVFADDEVRGRAAERLTTVAAEAARFCRGLVLLKRLAAEVVSGTPIGVDKPPAGVPVHRVFDSLRSSVPYQALLRAGDDLRWPHGPDRDDWTDEVALVRQGPWRGAIWIDCSGVGFRRPLTDTPFGAAFAAASGDHVPRRLVHATKMLRSHAPEWFDTAYALALARILDVDLDGLTIADD